MKVELVVEKFGNYEKGHIFKDMHKTTALALEKHGIVKVTGIKKPKE